MKKIRILLPLTLAALVFCGIHLASQPDASNAAQGEAVQIPGYNPSAADKVVAAVRQALGEKPIKEYHQKIHQGGTSCQMCHSGEAPSSAPSDANCIRCHGSPEQMAQKTAKLERNPHKSPHYGVYVPCTSCHKEHRPSKVLCYDCHTFKYENFKK